MNSVHLPLYFPENLKMRNVLKREYPCSSSNNPEYCDTSKNQLLTSSNWLRNALKRLSLWKLNDYFYDMYWLFRIDNIWTWWTISERLFYVFFFFFESKFSYKQLDNQLWSRFWWYISFETLDKRIPVSLISFECVDL